VEIPANTSAEIWVPATDGRARADAARAQFLRAEGGYAVFRVPSGRYTFTSTAP